MLFRSVAAQDGVWLRADDASIAAANNDLLSDAILFGANARAVDKVFVNDIMIVEDGRHCKYDEALRGYKASLKRLGLS